MNEIVKLEFIEGEARVSHDLIAKGMGIDHQSVRRLIDSHSEDFEAFGVLRFEITKPPEGSSGGRPSKMYYLNEQQATLAMTYLRNSDQARAFKMALVRAFYAMKSQLEHGGGDATVFAKGIEMMANAQMQNAQMMGVLAQGQNQNIEMMSALVSGQNQNVEMIGMLMSGQNQIIELIAQLQSNTPIRESVPVHDERVGHTVADRKSISDIQKERLVCINPQFHDNPEEREMFTMNIVDILKRYPAGMSQGALLTKSDYPESTRTRRWLQDGIGAFWNMEIKPGRGYLYFI